MSTPVPPGPTGSTLADTDVPPAVVDAATIQTQAVRGSLWTVMSTVVSLPLGLLSVAVAARFLDVAGFGRYTLYSFLIPLGIALVDLGLSSSLTWAATTGRASNHQQVIDALHTTVTWNLLKLPIIVLGSIVLLSDSWGAGIVLSVALSAFLMSEGLAIAIAADRRYRVMSQGAVLGSLVSAAGVATAAVLTRSPEWTVAAFWTGRLGAIPYFVWAAPRDLRPAALRPGRLLLDRRAWSFGLSSYASSLLTIWVFGRSELIFLGRYGGAFAAGQFAMVTTVAQRATLLADALYGAIGIALVSLRGADRARFVAAFARALRFAALLAIGAAVLLTPAVSFLASPIFGAQFGNVVLPCAIVFCVALIRTGTQPLLGWVYAERVGRALVLPGMVATAVDLILCLLLIPRAAFEGAIIASTVSSLTFLMLTAVIAGLPPLAWQELVRTGSRLAVVMAVCLLCIRIPWPGPIVARVATATLLGTVMTFALTRVLPPLLTARDIESVRPSLPRVLRPILWIVLNLFNGKTAP